MTATIPGHHLDQPTEADFVAALGDADTARALIDLTNKRLHPSRPATPDDLVRLADALMEIGNLTRVTARSQKIRAITYRALHVTAD